MPLWVVLALTATLEDGDAELAQWETQVRECNADNACGGWADRKKRYVLYERWGYLSGKELADAGVSVPEADWTEIFPSCVWILGNSVIKAAINPLEGVDIPYGDADLLSPFGRVKTPSFSWQL